jgi:hypothetical protein
MVKSYDPEVNFPRNTNVTHQYIWFTLCKPPKIGQMEKDYYYRINLIKTVDAQDVPYVLDPGIHHTP